MGDHFSHPNLVLSANTLCRKIVHADGRASCAVMENLRTGETYHVIADHFIVAAGVHLGPRLLHVSGIGGDNVGRYLTDHPVCFTQVVLHQKHLDWALTQPSTAGKIKSGDRIPIPENEPDPQMCLPYTDAKPWHTQVHRCVGTAAFLSSSLTTSAESRSSTGSSRTTRTRERSFICDGTASRSRSPRTACTGMPRTWTSGVCPSAASCASSRPRTRRSTSACLRICARWPNPSAPASLATSHTGGYVASYAPRALELTSAIAIWAGAARPGHRAHRPRPQDVRH